MSLTNALATASLLAVEDRAALLETFGERVRFDEPLAEYTSWKVGGPADAFAVAESEDEVAQVMALLFQAQTAVVRARARQQRAGRRRRIARYRLTA